MLCQIFDEPPKDIQREIKDIDKSRTDYEKAVEESKKVGQPGRRIVFEGRTANETGGTEEPQRRRRHL